jgi:hypothetical protein
MPGSGNGNPLRKRKRILKRESRKSSTSDSKNYSRPAGSQPRPRRLNRPSKSDSPIGSPSSDPAQSIAVAKPLEITRLLRSPNPQIPSKGRLLPAGLAVNNAILGVRAEPEPRFPAARSWDSELDFVYWGGPRPFPARQAMMPLISAGFWITAITAIFPPHSGQRKGSTS